MSVDSGKKRKPAKKLLLVVIILILAAVIVAGVSLYAKIRVVKSVVNIVTNDGHMAIEYHVDYNTEDNDEEEGLIKSLGRGNSGFLICDKQGEIYHGTCYVDGNSEPLFEFYRDSDDIIFNLRTMLVFLAQTIENNSEFDLLEPTKKLSDCYITKKQVQDFFDVNISEINVDWEAVAKRAAKFKRCDAPGDIHTSVDPDEMYFYEIELDNEDQQLVFGIPKTATKDSSILYISIKNKTMRLELYGAFTAKDDIKIDVPEKTFEDSEIRKYRRRYNIIKAIINILF